MNHIVILRPEKIREMMKEVIDQSDADVIILGGDLNTQKYEFLGT